MHKPKEASTPPGQKNILKKKTKKIKHKGKGMNKLENKKMSNAIHKTNLTNFLTHLLNH